MPSLSDTPLEKLAGQRGFTALPNLFIDQLLPALGDTEWRLLVVVARQTLGWASAASGNSSANADSGESIGSRQMPATNRKRADWLTQAQLKSRTGRASEAVSRALGNLVQRGLITVSSANGQPLSTPESRRAYSGRVSYRLSDELLALCQPDSVAPSPNSDSGVRKANTTKERTYKRITSNMEVEGRTTAESPTANPAITPVRVHRGWQRAGDILDIPRRKPPLPS